MEPGYLRQTKSLNPLFVFLFLAAAVVALYSISLGHNFLFDEENIILRNPYLKSFSNIPHIFSSGFFYMGGTGSGAFLEYYRPFSVLTFMADYHFWKANPLGYNLTSLLCHIFLSLALFEWLKRYLKHMPAAFLSALFYAVHPIHTEAIGHVSCRSETLAVAALLLTLVFYFRAAKWPASIFMVMGFLSKESSVLIPVYLWAADLVFLNGPAKERVRRLAPFFILSAIYVLFRKFFCPVKMYLTPEPLMDVLLRVFSMGPALIRYFKTLLWPPPFQLFGSISFARNFTSPQIFISVLFFSLILAAIGQAWRWRSPAWLAAVFLFAGFLPYFQGVHFFPEWAEHFLTAPAIGFAMLLGLFLRAGLEFKKKWVGKIVLAVMVIYLGFLSIRTYQRNALYNDPDRYYAELSASSSPYAVHGIQERAKLRMADGRFTEAKEILEEALTMPLNQDVTHDLLGWCQMNLADPISALESFRKAQALSPDIPQYAKDSAWALAKLERYDEAAQIYEKILQADPKDYFTYRQLVQVEESAGRPDRAADWGRKGMELFAGSKFEQASLAAALLKLYDRQNKNEEFTELLREFIKNYSDVPWFGEVGKFLSGQIDKAAFLKWSEENFPGFKEEAESYTKITRRPLFK